MNRRRTRLAWILGNFLLALSLNQAFGQVEGRAPTTLYDLRLGELRRASVTWDNKKGPIRKVVDQVVLVPDVPAFFEAIASWDDGNYFPVLIDDADLAPKFIRAFHPSRVIRYPSRPKAVEGRALWTQATHAVAQAWTRELPNPPEPPEISNSIRVGEGPLTSNRRGNGPRGDVVPSWLAPTPPGVVVSNPGSPSLAGAVALAAGRFQPLLLWEPLAKKGTPLNQAEALQLSLDLETELSDIVKNYGLLGDDCDFLTLAAPYPDHYSIQGSGMKAGLAAFDDLLGRNRESLRRWAYVGRLTGNPSESVYLAMCSLFLQPKSALLFDGYDEADRDFRGLAMGLAALKMPRELPSTVVKGANADIQGWQRVLGPFNEFDFIYVNTQGGISYFDLIANSRAYTGDIPMSVPAIVLMNHSYSAAVIDDPNSLAGAWLSGGAYIYYGSMNEPFIQAFRTPSLVASLIGEGLPLAAVVRMGPDENRAFGTPWRLQFFGDPLFEFNPRTARAPRWPIYEPTQSWPVYADEPAPAATASPTARLAWAAKATILDAMKSNTGPPREAVETILVGMKRESLPPNLRVILDDLRIDAMPRSREHTGELLIALGAVPAAEATPALIHAVLHGRLARFRRAAERADWAVCLNLWDDIQQSSAPGDHKEFATKHVGSLASKANHLVTWKARLNAILTGKAASPETKYLRDELERINKATGKGAAPSLRRGG